MGIIELLERVGEGNVKVQFLADSMTNISTNSKSTETKITFATDPEVITATDVGCNCAGFVGVVIWLPADAVKKAQRDGKAAETAHV